MGPVSEAESLSERAVKSCCVRVWFRRICLWCLVAAVLTLTYPVHAQEQKRLEIGVLALGPRNAPAWRCGQQASGSGGEERRRETSPQYVLGLLDELERTLRYIEVGSDGRPKKPLSSGSSGGRRFVLDLRMGTQEQVRAAAREFVQKRIDVIVAVAAVAVRIAQEETRGSSIPVLMTGVSEPVKEGFVQSLARPGGFITGVSHQLVQGSGKRVELFKEMLPGLQRLISIRTRGYSVSEHSVREVRPVADRLGVELVDWTVSTQQDLHAVLAKMRGDATGLLIPPDSFIISNLDVILETSLAQRVPAFGLQDYMADWGAIAAYGPSPFRAGAHVAHYVDKISKGAKPGDMPVEPIDPTFVINLKVAECLGLSLPLRILQQADRVIQ